MNYLIILVVILNFVFTLIYYLRTKCEVPLLLAVFNALVLYRNIALQNGWGEWVNFNYSIAFVFDNEMAAIVTNLMTLGSTVMIYAFMMFYSQPKKAKVVHDSNDMLRTFTLKNKNIIFAGLGLFSFFELVLSGRISANYAFLAILGNTSFIIMFFLITAYTDKKKAGLRLIYFAVFVVLAYVSYSPRLRFQFLAWMITIGYYLTRHIKPAVKTIYFAIGMVVVLVLFSVAGVLRNPSFWGASKTELVSESFDRIKAAEDVNFIDGFIMMYEVYPRYLDFTYGMQHLEIFLRPIPRTLWPNKPLAGWFQNYAAKYGTQQVTIGFSPTIYGVFYTETGISGLFIFGIIWGWLLSYLYRSFSGFASDLGPLLVGVLLASLVPILRSGDLPGDFAVVLMSFWPFIIFVRRYKKFVKQQLKLQNG